ncbi:MAG: hypothetical protein ACU83U_11075 [Gammaproteobacteria bacterium]
MLDTLQKPVEANSKIRDSAFIIAKRLAESHRVLDGLSRPIHANARVRTNILRQ